jgi:hypothetical protein
MDHIWIPSKAEARPSKNAVASWADRGQTAETFGLAGSERGTDCWAGGIGLEEVAGVAGDGAGFVGAEVAIVATS